MAEQQTILVVGEIQDGKLSATTAELLAAGRGLAQQGGTTLAVTLWGSDLGDTAQQAIQAGADRVYTVADGLLGTPQIDLVLAAMTAVCQTVSPDIVLLGRTDLGRELAPRLACRLGVSLMQDCMQVELDTDTGRLTATRPVYGGSVLARVRCTSTPQVAAIRP